MGLVCGVGGDGVIAKGGGSCSERERTLEESERNRRLLREYDIEGSKC